MSSSSIDLSVARAVLRTEASAVLALVARLDARVEHALRLLLDCRGRVVVTGIGKSGLIARKLASTLTSTGTPALFLHPAEAVHGDLGIVQADDVVLALSNSGETPEIVRLLASIHRKGATLITMTGQPSSTLARASTVVLDVSVREEACPMNTVPTASTTAALAMGDAIAVTLMIAKGFHVGDFHQLHPGGAIGPALDARLHGAHNKGDTHGTQA